MGNSHSSDDSETMVPSASTVSGALSSLWSTSSDKDDTCVQWGLVSRKCKVHGYYHSKLNSRRARRKELLDFSLVYAWDLYVLDWLGFYLVFPST